MGAVAERGRLIPALVFIFAWATIVYCPVACWVWNVNGWAFNYGVLDYAGGGPVEIVSGMSALAYSMVLGRRQERMVFRLYLGSCRCYSSFRFHHSMGFNHSRYRCWCYLQFCYKNQVLDPN